MFGQTVPDSMKCIYVFSNFVWDSNHLVPPCQVLLNN